MFHCSSEHTNVTAMPPGVSNFSIKSWLLQDLQIINLFVMVFIPKGAGFLGWVKLICYTYLYFIYNISICYEKVTEKIYVKVILTYTTYLQ